MLCEAHTISSPSSPKFIEIIERYKKRIQPCQPKKTRSHGISRSEKFEGFLEDKKKTESDLWRKAVIKSAQKKLTKEIKLSLSTEPWGGSKYKE